MEEEGEDTDVWTQIMASLGRVREGLAVVLGLLAAEAARQIAERAGRLVVRLTKRIVQIVQQWGNRV